MEVSATTKDLRSFGLLVGSILAVLGIWPLLFHGEPLRVWMLAPAATLLFLGAAWPAVLRPVHKRWMMIGHVLGWMNTRIILGIVFYGMITPIGLLSRLMRKDPMRKAFRADDHTYRVPKVPRLRGHMKYQF